MRVDGEHHLVDRRLQLNRRHRFRNQLGGLRADDVHAENLAVLRVGDHLHEAVVRSTIVAFELPTNGNLPTFTVKPFSLACASVRPTLAICGSQ